jgi:hypothetical protein
LAESDPSHELIPDSSLSRVAERYAGTFAPPPISYGTVRDFADSRDSMPGLAGANRDMKDLQRCWALKAVLGRVPRGGRLLEIGAGDPLVAAILSRLGYAVTVVDPYDGSDGGPREYEDFLRSYPEIEIVRDRFPPPPGAVAPGLAAIYSISVLEHVPEGELDALLAAAGELLDPGGVSIHAIDHVFAGWGADAHAAHLRRIAAATGLADAELEGAVSGLHADPEAYLVSAEAHEGWRGDLPYDEYPMRRIGSIQLVTAPPRSAAPPA